MQHRNEGEMIRIDLTVDQKARITAESGKEAEAIELTVRELEERLAPRLSSNHSETLLRTSAA